MTQTDLNAANAAGAVYRADMNDHLEALATQSAGATAPSVTFPNQPWFDTANNLMKQRNNANTAWVTIAAKDGSGWRPYYNGSQIDSVFLQTANVVGQQTIWIPAAAMTPRTTNGPARATQETTTHMVMISGLDFDKDTNEYAQFSFQAPKGWDEGTLIFQFLWKDATTAGSGTVRWTAEALARSNDDALDTAFGAGVSVNDAFIASGDLHVTAETSALTAGGTPVEEDLIIVQVFRAAQNAADTYTQDARLIGVRVHYTTDAPTDD